MMESLLAIFYGLLMGLVFGLALEKSRVFEPGMIVGQLQLRNFTMLKVFLSAATTSLLVLAAMHGIFGVELHPKPTFYAAQVVGGLVFGVGMALAGACPGTVMAQIGVGYRDAWFVLLGGVLGAMTFGYTHDRVSAAFFAEGPGEIRVDTLLGVPFWAAALVFAGLLAAGLAALERWRPWRRDLGEHYDGLFAGREAAPPAKPAGAGAKGARPRHA
jgi:hypothetical protein